MRFTLRQLLAGVTFVAVALTVVALIPRSVLSRRVFNQVTGLAYSPDGKTLAVVHLGARDAGVSGKGYLADVSDTIHLLTTSDLAITDTIHHDFYPGNQGPALAFRHGPTIAFSADQKYLYHSPRYQRFVRRFDFASRDWSLVQISQNSDIIRATVSSHGQCFAIWDRSGRMNVWDVRSQKSGPSLGKVGWTFFSADGRRLAVTSPCGIEIWNLVDNSLIATLHESKDSLDNVTCVAFSPQGNFVGYRCNEGVHLHDLVNGSERALLPEYFEVHRSANGWGTSSRGPRTFGITFSIDGRLLAAWGEYGLKFFDMSNGAKLLTQATDRPITHLVFSPDGKSFATADGKGRIAIWDIDTGKEIRSTTLQHKE